MNSIHTIEALTTILDNATPVDYAKIMKNIELDKNEITAYETWTTKGYTRNCLARTDKYELILICWDAETISPIHCHGGNDCWVYQIEGTLEEKRFETKNNQLIETHIIKLTPTKLTYMHDRMGYHSIGNSSSKKAMSLHIYASPIDNCTIYNTDKNCFDSQELSYDTFRGVSI